MTDITTLRAHLVTAEASLVSARNDAQAAQLQATAARLSPSALLRGRKVRREREAADAVELVMERFYAAVVCRDRARAAVLAAEEAVA